METFSALLALGAGNSPVTGEFPAQMASNKEKFQFNDVIICGMGAVMDPFPFVINMYIYRRDPTWALRCLSSPVSRLYAS